MPPEPPEPSQPAAARAQTRPQIAPQGRYDLVEMTDEQIAAEVAEYGALADAARRVNQACLRTTLEGEDIREATERLNAVAAVLEREQIDGSFGVSFTRTGKGRTYGNAVVGVRNPVAVPLQIAHSPEGRASASFHLSALYEGPPGLVHGGVAALILDQIAGEAAAAGGSPGMTGTLTLRYRAGTPLGDCSAEAWIERVEGVKTFVNGHLRNADGEVTVEAEGIFILPKWARKALASGDEAPTSYE